MLKFLNSREVRQIAAMAEQQWGASFPEDVFVAQRREGDIFFVSRDLEKLDFSQLFAISVGLYIGELRDDGLRLSIEGSQVIGPAATRNIVRISRQQLRQWLSGEDLLCADVDAGCTGFVILKSGHDFVGCGKMAGEKILNFVPKARRVRAD